MYPASINTLPSAHYVYVHGFNSSPQSYKARLLGRWFEQLGIAERYSVPALSYQPAEAMEQLEWHLAGIGAERVVLLGSSLGGYYATWLVETLTPGRDLRAVLINPRSGRLNCSINGWVITRISTATRNTG